MGSKFDFDTIVIGSGPAGSAAARALAGAKQKVAVVEKGRWGGAGYATRDVPAQACFNFSHLYARAVAGARFGLSSSNLHYNYPTVAHWRDRAVARADAGKKSLEDAGITCISGRAQFVNTYQIAVGERGRVSAKKFIIATGSVPKTSGITGLDTVPCLTPATALRVNRPPKSVIVMGGGSSGCEIAQYYAELGSKVAIIEAASQLLPREDLEAGQVLGQYFDKRLGIKVLTGTKVVAIAQDSTSKKAVLARAGRERTVRAEALVLAIGSLPATDMGLENAGIKYTEASIKADKSLQTSARTIYAIGDVLGGDSSLERATYEANIAAANILGHSKTYAAYAGFMRVTDTDPQIASVGVTETELRQRERKFKKALVPLAAVSAANTQDFKMGYAKMLADMQGKIIGASVMAPGAAEVLQEVSLAIRHHLSVVEIASTPHVASNWSDAVRLAARKLARG